MRSLIHASHLFFGAVLMTGCAPPTASSEPQGTVLAVDQVAGFYALRGQDGSRCDLSLGNLVVDGVQPVLAERCGVKAAASAKSWRATAGGFELLNADGSVAMTFRRTGVDDFEAVDGGYTLSRAPIA